LDSEKIIYSVGHSTYPIEHFLTLLEIFKIKAIVDVRRFPTSKKYPQFERQNLQNELDKVSIEYHWLGEFLGGFRKGGYQLYMQSDSFSHGIQELVKVAEQEITAVMCAEKLCFHCHRRFIADQLLQLNWQVIHICDEKITRLHKHADTKPLDF